MVNNWNFIHDEETIKKQLDYFKKHFKTKTSLKWSLIFLLGIIPMLIAWVLFGGNGSNKIFNSSEATNAFIAVDYGFQWLIAIAIIIGAFIAAYLVIKKNKEVKGDIYGNIIGFSFIIINFWLFNIGGWRWLTFIFMYFAGYLSAQFVRFILFFNSYKKKAAQIQQDINNMYGGDQNPFFQNQQQHNKHNQNNQKNHKDYSKNDSTTIDIEKKDDQNEDDHK